MMPWMVPYLHFTDDSLKSTFQEQLSLMRKNRLFCDVVLHVENTEIPAHRNVLACVSPYLMELFSAEHKVSNDGNIPSYRLNGYITKEGLNILVEYAYTAKLEVPEEMIKQVYLAAWQLRMEQVVNQCAAFLVKDLSLENSLEIRSLPGINRNKDFVSKVDQFITEHFVELAQTTSFLQLPSIQIEILHQTKQEMTMVAEDSLCRLTLDWIKREISEHESSIASLSERSRMLFLALDNTYKDVSDLIGERANSDIVTDYKKLALKNPNNNSKARRKCVSQPEKPRILLYSRDISDRNTDEENVRDWNVIASTKLSENTVIVLVTINGALTRISIQMRVNNVAISNEVNASNVTTPSPIPTESSFDGKDFGAVEASDIEQPELFLEIATMSENKCGMGVAAYDGKIFCVGGYGRTECLKTVESYCPITNKWTEGRSLKEARGRVNAALVGNVLYIIGGSNGVNELDTVECLPLDANLNDTIKWKKLENLPFARSNAGVCALNGKIYCIGGNATGQNSVKDCHVFCPETNTWTSIAPLNTGRCQAGVVAFEDKLIVAGGSDSWNCLNTVECYDPEEDKWTFMAPMLTARRGCGLSVHNGKIYCIGGSDGSQSLKSIEFYDSTSKTWILGPSLNTARAGVGVAVIESRLYAIGGFSGKNFLNTIEYFDEETNEWTKFAKLQPISKSSSSSNSCGSSNGQVDEETIRDMMMLNELNRMPSKMNSEKDRIREDESESNTVIMPLS